VTNIDELFSAFVFAAPEIQALVDEHVANNHGELLGHVLIPDVERFVASRFTGQIVEPATVVPTESEVRGMMAALDAAMRSGDKYTRSAIAVSFLEYPWLAKHYTKLRPFLGPALLGEIERQRNWDGAG